MERIKKWFKKREDKDFVSPMSRAMDAKLAELSKTNIHLYRALKRRMANTK